MDATTARIGLLLFCVSLLILVALIAISSKRDARRQRAAYDKRVKALRRAVKAARQEAESQLGDMLSWVHIELDEVRHEQARKALEQRLLERQRVVEDHIDLYIRELEEE